MSLNIANSTTQDVVFHYRLWAENPADRLARHVTIMSGRQAEIGHGWNSDQTERVVKQLERHGARDAAEAYNGNLGSFHGLLYRRAGVIAKQEIEGGHEAVVETQQQRSVTEATRAALGFDRAVNQGNRGQRRAKVTAVEVEQLSAPHERRTGNEVSFSLSVDPEGRQDVRV